MIKVIDNFIPKQYQEEIKSTLLGRHFQWFYASDVTYRDDNSNPAMFHVYRSENQTQSNFYDFLNPMIYNSDMEIKQVVQARSFLQFPLAGKRNIDKLHVDLPYKHTVLLYYVMDSDGDTILVNNKMQDNNSRDDLNLKDYKILEKISPKQGRAVIFDGRYYHTAEQPKENMRCIINFDLITQYD